MIISLSFNVWSLRPIVAAFLVLALIAMAAPVVMARLRFRGQRIELEQDQS